MASRIKLDGQLTRTGVYRTRRRYSAATLCLTGAAFLMLMGSAPMATAVPLESKGIGTLDEDEDAPWHLGDGKTETANPGDDDQDLAATESEIRGNAHYFAALGFGPSLPWQSLHGEAGRFRANGTQNYGLFAGTGKFTASYLPEQKREEDKTWKAQISTKSLGGFWRLYPSKKHSFFLRGAGLLGSWQVNYPHFDDQTEASTQVNKSVWVASLAGEIGYTFLWPRGFYLENTLVGFGMTRLLSGRSTDLVEPVRREMNKSRVWGLFNITAGYLW